MAGRFVEGAVLMKGKAGLRIRPFLFGDTAGTPWGCLWSLLGENMMKRRRSEVNDWAGIGLYVEYLKRINFITDCPDRKDGGIVCT